MAFIVFEGIDGTGKGSMIKLAVDYLRKRARNPEDVILTKEPGGTPLGAEIRTIMFEKIGSKNMVPGVIDLLFLASHMQNWQTVVMPGIAAGKVVVSDRWWYSQLAYMTERYVPESIVDAYLAERGEEPDLVFFLWGDPAAMVARARSRTTETHQSSKAWDDAAALNKIQDNYKRIFADKPFVKSICVDHGGMKAAWEQIQSELMAYVLKGSHAHS